MCVHVNDYQSMKITCVGGSRHMSSATTVSPAVAPKVAALGNVVEMPPTLA